MTTALPSRSGANPDPSSVSNDPGHASTGQTLTSETAGGGGAGGPKRASSSARMAAASHCAARLKSDIANTSCREA